MIPEIADLTLEQKIGQMCIFGFFGKEPSPELTYLIRNRHAGNVIVFARNFSNAHELQDICLSLHAETTIPPLIAIDQEGGVVTRITEGASLLPGNMAVAAAGNTELAYKYGEVIGRELRALGVNLNLAPVLDVNHPDNPGIGVRSFGSSPEEVTRYGLELIKGLQDQNISATAKHFPGKGSATLDTHLELAVIDKPVKELEAVDIPPFSAAIDAGIDCIMTSHAGFPAFTPGKPVLPGTFTPEIMTGYLRNKLGFKGVLITDDLEMGAATRSLDFAESIIASVKAGADLLCVCHTFDLQKLAIDTLIGEVKNGGIPESTINRSISRIFAIKKQFKKNREAFFNEDIDVLVSEHTGIVREISEKSITVYDKTNLIPLNLLSDDAIILIIPRLKEFTPVEELKSFFQKSEKSIIDLTRKFHPKTRHVMFPLPPDAKSKTRVVEAAEQGDLLIFCSYNAHLDEDQSGMLRSVLELNIPLVLLMLRNPFDRLISPKIETSLALHAPMHTVIEAGIKRIFQK